MIDLFEKLDTGSVVLDLGSGSGSFDYMANTHLEIIGIEPFFLDESDPTVQKARREHPAVRYYETSASDLSAVAASSVDAVVANNTFEHFDDIPGVLQELQRVLKRDAYIYAALPDGNGYDDRLYRWLWNGGGHVNQFGFDEFVALVCDTLAGFQLDSSIEISSGFNYLRPVSPETAHQARPSARWVVSHPRCSVLVRNALAVGSVACDAAFGSHTHRYGFGYYFSRGHEGENRLQFPRANMWTCIECGTVLRPERSLPERLRCQNCGASNIVFRTRQSSTA